MQKSQWKSAGKDSINYLKTKKTNQNVLEDKEGEQILFTYTKANRIIFCISCTLIFLISKKN